MNNKHEIIDLTVSDSDNEEILDLTVSDSDDEEILDLTLNDSDDEEIIFVESTIVESIITDLHSAIIVIIVQYGM